MVRLSPTDCDELKVDATPRALPIAEAGRLGAFGPTDLALRHALGVSVDWVP